MNKRVKIVATLGPAVETVVVKNWVKMDTGVKTDVEASAKTLLN